MSNQVTALSASGFAHKQAFGALHAIHPVTQNVVTAIGAPRKTRAPRVVRTVIRGIATERLVAFGWTMADIRRPQWM